MLLGRLVATLATRVFAKLYEGNRAVITGVNREIIPYLTFLWDGKKIIGAFLRSEFR